MLTSEDLKVALKNKAPIVCEDKNGVIEYARATAVIYKYNDKTGNIEVSVKLLDKNGKTAVEALAKSLRFKE